MIPNYKENNSINLMSSIQYGLGTKSKYTQLSKELTKEIKEASNVVLFVIDGVGSDSLQKLGKNSFLVKNKVQDLQSVFPATTASAVTTFYTGLAPQEHGITGWDMNLKEFGTIISILPMVTSQGQRIPLDEETSYLPKSIFDKINVSCYKIGTTKLFKSDYNKILGKNAEFGKINTFNSLLNKISKTVKAKIHLRLLARL